MTIALFVGAGAPRAVSLVAESLEALGKDVLIVEKERGAPHAVTELHGIVDHLTPEVTRGLLATSSPHRGRLHVASALLPTSTAVVTLLQQTYDWLLVPLGDAEDDALTCWSTQAAMIIAVLGPESSAAQTMAQLVTFLTARSFPRGQIGFLIVDPPGTLPLSALAAEWGVRSLGTMNGHGTEVARTLLLARDEACAASSTVTPPTDMVQRAVTELQRRIEREDGCRRPSSDPRLAREQLTSVVRDILSRFPEQTTSPVARDRLLQTILDHAVGLGPLESLLADPTVTEVMVNGTHGIYVERAGRVTAMEQCITNETELKGIIERIVTPLGRRIDESSPLVDARLPDGSRVNIIIPPLAIDGPAITIRRFDSRVRGMTELVAMGMLPQSLATFLAACVRGRINTVVSGGTGTGKTTFLNALAAFAADDERIITIEDAAELKLAKAHVVRLEARPANIEGAGAVTIRELVRNSLRMRPDRIIIGEVRGAEALDMLQAMNTGHDGSLTTVHANSARDALRRLETMVLFAGLDLPVRAIREQIVSAIELIVQLKRFPDGRRRVVEVCALAGLEGETVTLQELLRYQAAEKNGEWNAAGFQPRFAEKLADRGLQLPVLSGGGS